MKFSSVIKKNALLMHATWVNLTDKKLSRRSQTQKCVLFDSAYMKFKYRRNWMTEVRLLLTSGGHD